MIMDIKKILEEKKKQVAENSVFNKKKKLFNPNAKEDIKIYGGDITNLFTPSRVKYPVFIDLYYKAYSHNWLPDIVSSMAEDKGCYRNKLTEEEKFAYNGILSYLVFLDSIQTNNLPNISEFITVPEITLWLVRQAYEESIHSLSYAYILENMLSAEEIEKIVYLWRNDPIALHRNKYIAELYQLFKDDDDDLAFQVLLVANYMLEGLYFYNGFAFFHNLAFRGLMTATNIQIKFIKRDEMLHCEAFKDIINYYKQENPDKWNNELVYSMFKEAVKEEIRFANHFIGNNVLGISKQTIEDYTYYLANWRLKEIGMNPIFPDRGNPYKHLDKIAAIEDETENKVNMFESTSTTYKDPSVFKGWHNLIEPDKEPVYVCERM
jgi:ribonucleoside-diphosphate reductase beta chain